jgi:hypothetical protein
MGGSFLVHGDYHTFSLKCDESPNIPEGLHAEANEYMYSKIHYRGTL